MNVDVEEKTMKLNLLFIVMELLTLLAYPIVFVHGKLRRVCKIKRKRPCAEFIRYRSSQQANDPLEIVNMRKKGNDAY